MATFNGFATFNVEADSEYVYITQMSIEYGKEVTIRIPCRLWNEVEAVAQNEMHLASDEVDA